MFSIKEVVLLTVILLLIVHTNSICHQRVCSVKPSKDWIVSTSPSKLSQVLGLIEDAIGSHHGLKWENLEVEKVSDWAQSCFVWMEDEPLDAVDEELRQRCWLNLCLPSLGSNGALVKQRYKFMSTASDRRKLFGRWSSFLSLTRDVNEISLDTVRQLKQGIDAVEIRADILDQRNKNFQSQISRVQSLFNLPVIFTVRTVGQLGRFPDQDFAGIMRLVMEGLRGGVDFVDVEASLPYSVRQDIVSLSRQRYSGTRIIGSVHDSAAKNETELQRLCHLAALNGNADIVKVVVGANGIHDCLNVHRVIDGCVPGEAKIALCVGNHGAVARALNKVFTPVTHDALIAAAPGQLSAKSLQSIRDSLGAADPQRFYLFGSPIQHSLSPLMHNRAFAFYGMNANYSLMETDDIYDLPSYLRSPAFGGASVTIPLKEKIIDFLDSIDSDAQEIGAVNTIVRRGEGSLVGYNTDWLGILKPFQRVAGQGVARSHVGVVFGAGGTARAACYAIKRLGMQLAIVNRNLTKARELAEAFGGHAMTIGELYNSSSHVKFVVSTLPFQANLTLDERFLSLHRPIVLDVVYQAHSTTLLSQARRCGCDVITGLQMLLTQAEEQFQLWSKRAAPRTEMADAATAHR